MLPRLGAISGREIDVHLTSSQMNKECNYMCNYIEYLLKNGRRCHKTKFARKITVVLSRTKKGGEMERNRMGYSPHVRFCERRNVPSPWEALHHFTIGR